MKFPCLSSCCINYICILNFKYVFDVVGLPATRAADADRRELELVLEVGEGDEPRGLALIVLVVVLDDVVVVGLDEVTLVANDALAAVEGLCLLVDADDARVEGVPAAAHVALNLLHHEQLLQGQDASRRLVIASPFWVDGTISVWHNLFP